MPPVAAAPPIIGTLGRRRRPVRAIRFARNAPRTPSQSPGEGRLPPVRVRLRSRQKPEHCFFLRGAATLSPFQWRALSSGTLALAFDGKRRPTRRSRVVSALQITTPATREGPARGACAENCLPVFQLARVFSKPQKPTGRVYYLWQTPQRRDLSPRRSRVRAAISRPLLWHHTFTASAQAPQAIPPNKIACRSV